MLESYFAILPDLTWYFEVPALEFMKTCFSGFSEDNGSGSKGGCG